MVLFLLIEALSKAFCGIVIGKQFDSSRGYSVYRYAIQRQPRRKNPVWASVFRARAPVFQIMRRAQRVLRCEAIDALIGKTDWPFRRHIFAPKYMFGYLAFLLILSKDMSSMAHNLWVEGDMKRLNLVIIIMLGIMTLGGSTKQAHATGDLAAIFEGIELAKSYKPLYWHNPLMTQRFGADPYAMVYGNRVYVYSTNDAIEEDDAGNIRPNSYAQIHSINRISSDDLVNWTDHGSISIGRRGLGKSSWAENSWAPAVTYKEIDGKDKFFLYYANSGNGIGVLTSDSPVGPFVDPIGRPLVSRSTKNCQDIVWLFDPAVLVDDDGKAYLYFGGGVPEGREEMPNTGRVVELGEDMISLAGTPIVVEAPYFFEAAYVHKMDDTYYYSYCSNWADRSSAVGKHVPPAGAIAYMTSDSPLGPWEYQGVIFDNPGRFFGSWGNNHHSLIGFKDKWYLFYHSQLLQDNMGISGGYRSTHADEVTITADGTILPIIGTRRGVEQVKSLNPYQLNEAETMAWAAGISTEETSEPSENYGSVNMVVADMSTGSFMGVSGADFGEEGPTTFTAKVSSVVDDNVIRIVAGNLTSEAIGYLKVPNTGDLDRFVEETVAVKNVTGKHDLFFIFAGESFQFDAWRFEE